jgi:cytochrome c oxidase cbb3-type subunit 3
MRHQGRRPRSGLAGHRKFILRPAIASLFAILFGVGSPNPSLVPTLKAQAGKPQAPNAAANSRSGADIFAISCSECHGLDGRGGERAPNIATRPAVQQLSDADLKRIIQRGIMGTGMPSFRSLQIPEVEAVVAYLRTLQGTAAALKVPGNPEQGRTLFFGTAQCSTCHMVNGEGGFIASDLSQFGGTHSAEQIRNAITNPNLDRQSQLAIVTTRKGQKYSGRIRNEDNFSLQLQTLDGTFHFLSKSDLVRLDYATQSLMPSNYGASLKPGELNDLISYLMTLGKPSRAQAEKEFEE